MKINTQTIILFLTAIVAIAEGSMGLLAELGLSPKAITGVRLAGFIAVTFLGILQSKKTVVEETKITHKKDVE